MLLNCGVGEVPWTARRSNQSIVKEISPEYSLEGLMLKLKLQYFGHLMWRTDSLEKIWMPGKIEERRKGWQRMRWLDGITDLIDMNLSKLQKLVLSEEAWCSAGGHMGSQRVRHDWVTELNYASAWMQLCSPLYCHTLSYYKSNCDWLCWFISWSLQSYPVRYVIRNRLWGCSAFKAQALWTHLPSFSLLIFCLLKHSYGSLTDFCSTTSKLGSALEEKPLQTIKLINGQSLLFWFLFSFSPFNSCPSHCCLLNRIWLCATSGDRKQLITNNRSLLWNQEVTEQWKDFNYVTMKKKLINLAVCVSPSPQYIILL